MPGIERIGKSVIGGLVAGFLAAVPAAQTFAVDHDRPDREYFPRDQLQRADGSYLVCGDAYIPGTQQSRPYVMRLDASGALLSQNEYALLPTFHRAEALIPWTAGRSIVLADVYGLQKPALFAVDADGSFLAGRGYAAGAAELTMEDFIRTRTGGFLLVGRTFTPATGGDVAVLELDAFGNPQWYRELTGSIPYPLFGADDLGTAVVEARSGDGYWVLGTLESDALLAKLDLDGDLVFQRTFSLAGGFLFERSLAWLETAGGGVLVASANLSNDLFPLVLRLDAAGDLVSTTVASFPMSATSAVVTADGGFAIAGASLIVPGAQGLRLAKYDAQANLSWAFQYDVQLTFATVNPPANLTQTADGGFLLSVAALSGIEPVQHTIKVAADGTTSCGATPLAGPFVFEVEPTAREVSVATREVLAPLLPFGQTPTTVDGSDVCD